jgi:hypothetical protein
MFTSYGALTAPASSSPAAEVMRKAGGIFIADEV